MSHTKTPWEVFAWKEEDGDKAANHHIRSASGQLIARAYKRNLDLVESEANAELIVRAVNSHDELLEAAKHALESLQFCMDQNEMNQHIPYGSIKNLEKAIKKAEGK